MMITDIIPQPVLKAAKKLIDRYGNRLAFVGKYNGQNVYVFSFPDDVETGFPFLYLYDEKQQTVFTVTGPKTLDIISEI